MTRRDPGIYAEMFDECYRELIARERYASIRGRFSADVSKIHNGYFSQDRKGSLKDTRGSTRSMELRTKERLKSHCGKRHFAALDHVGMSEVSSF